MTQEDKNLLLKDLPMTNWEQIEKRVKESETALVYMQEHPLTREQAVEQTQRLKEKVMTQEDKKLGMSKENKDIVSILKNNSGKGKVLFENIHFDNKTGTIHFVNKD